MIEITLKAQIGDLPALSLAVVGDVITINGDKLDLSSMQDGDVIEDGATDCLFVQGAIRKVAGMVQIALLFPCRPGAGKDARFPVPILVSADGPVALPPNGD